MKPRVKYGIINKLKNKYPIEKMCNFYQVSASGYYKWLKNEQTNCREVSDRAVADAIVDIHNTTNQTYGYRRMRIALLRTFGLIINHKALLRIMLKYNLLSVIRRKPKYMPSKAVIKLPNVLNRDFSAGSPNSKWLTDITYIKTAEGLLSVSAIKDCFDGSIIAYKYSTQNSVGLVTNTIKAALKKEHSNGNLIIHSDQGHQYTNQIYRNLLTYNNIEQSMSRRGNCWDNAPMESFFGTMKSECLNFRKIATLNEAKELVDWYINFYNYDRIQFKTKMPPFELRKNFLNRLVC